MDGKGLIHSKIFWVQLLTTIGTIAGFLPPKYSVPVAGIVTVILRMTSGKQVTSIFGSTTDGRNFFQKLFS